jgi:uncharacterized membrane protein YeaQ/YmgE (transglycosylase-associated protein family)
MYLLAWIVVGAVVDWGAGKVFQGNGYGPLMDILMEVSAAVVGGLVMHSVGLGRGYGGRVITALISMVRGSASDCGRRLRERKKDLRPPAVESGHRIVQVRVLERTKWRSTK